MKHPLPCLALLAASIWIGCDDGEIAGASGIGNPKIDLAFGIDSTETMTSFSAASSNHDESKNLGLIKLNEVHLWTKSIEFKSASNSYFDTTNSFISPSSNHLISGISNIPNGTYQRITLHLGKPTDSSHSTMELAGTIKGFKPIPFKLMLNFEYEMVFADSNIKIDTGSNTFALKINTNNLLKDPSLLWCINSNISSASGDQALVIRADLDSTCMNLRNQIQTSMDQIKRKITKIK